VEIPSARIDDYRCGGADTASGKAIAEGWIM
jgi:hypothetical protein